MKNIVAVNVVGSFVTNSLRVYDVIKGVTISGYSKVRRFFSELDWSNRVPERFSVRKAQAYGLFVLCALTAWLRGGTHPALQAPLIIMPMLLGLSILFLAPAERARFLAAVGADPVFRYGAALLGLIVLQSLNSKYWVITNDAGAMEMARNPPRLFPWSVDPMKSWEMFAWFFPALVGALVVRHLFEWRHVKLLLHLLMWNAGVLALVGVLQHMAGAGSMLGIWSVPGGRFFASFDYVNHAAQWFYLSAFIALAMLKDNFDKKKPPMQAAVWTVILLLCVLAALLTLSRFGAFVALAVLFIGLSMVARRVLRKVSGAGTANVVVSILIIALLGVVLFLGAGGGSLAHEVGDKSMFGENSVAGDLGDRLVQMPMALSICADYPLFGSGGWGYRWLARLHVSPDDAVLWEAAGKANVHCDPMQFFSEFGLLGAAALMWIMVQLVIPAIKSWKMSAASLWIGVGVVVIAVHSLIDLPFRCPAILCLWVILLAAHPLLSARAAVKVVSAEKESS